MATVERRRLATWLWILWAVVVWNVVFDRVIINAMTRLRVCTPSGAMALDYKGEPGDAPGDRIPWFDMPGRASRTHAIVCGHWSALGLLVRDDLMSLDSGLSGFIRPKHDGRLRRDSGSRLSVH